MANRGCHVALPPAAIDTAVGYWAGAEIDSALYSVCLALLGLERGKPMKPKDDLQTVSATRSRFFSQRGPWSLAKGCRL